MDKNILEEIFERLNNRIQRLEKLLDEMEKIIRTKE